MKIVRTVKAWQEIRSTFPASKSIGYVATMGNLHVGHESLFIRSKKENDISVASLFINPMQFNDKKDYEKYPRTEEEDLTVLKRAQVDYVLIPLKEDIYQDDYSFQIHTTHPLSQIMEGVYRPGHFDGMLTIVLKLLMLVKPNNAYFGEKDYQQLILIREMVKAYFLETNIIGCETIRELSGLAYSSSNNLLTTSEKVIADNINKVLNSTQPLENIKAALTGLGLEVEYVEKYNERIFTAVRIGRVRLIDNFVF